MVGLRRHGWRQGGIERTLKVIARHDLDGYTLSEHQAVQTWNLSKGWSMDAKDVASLLNSDQFQISMSMARGDKISQSRQVLKGENRSERQHGSV